MHIDNKKQRRVAGGSDFCFLANILSLLFEAFTVLLFYYIGKAQYSVITFMQCNGVGCIEGV